VTRTLHNISAPKWTCFPIPDRQRSILAHAIVTGWGDIAGTLLKVTISDRIPVESTTRARVYHSFVAPVDSIQTTKWFVPAVPAHSVAFAQQN